MGEEMREIKFRGTPKKELRNLIHETQEGIDAYFKLSKRKQRKKENRDAYTDLVSLDRTLKEGYYRQLKLDDVQKWKSIISNRKNLLSNIPPL